MRADEEAPRRITIGAQSSLSGAASNPVLAQHPDRFEFTGGPTNRLLAPVAALGGVVLVFAGASRMIGEDGFAVEPWGIGLVAIGIFCVLPMLRRLRRGEATWRLRKDGRSRHLRTAVFTLDGDEERASTVWQAMAHDDDTRAWPVLNNRRTKGDIRIGLALESGDARPIISIWMPHGQEALCWPLVEPRAADTSGWVSSSLFRNDPHGLDPHQYPV